MYKINKLIFIEYGNDYDIITPIKLKRNHTPNNSELRLGIDLVNEMYPLFKYDKSSKPEFLKDVLNFNTTAERVNRLLTHKKLLLKKVITIEKNKIIIKRVRKIKV